MADRYDFPGYQLPVTPAFEQGTLAHGFVTPTQDRIPQIVSIPPRRVLPIIFLPGTMGSNLRISAARQAMLELPSNIAWRPDHLLVTFACETIRPRRGSSVWIQMQPRWIFTTLLRTRQVILTKRRTSVTIKSSSVMASTNGPSEPVTGHYWSAIDLKAQGKARQRIKKRGNGVGAKYSSVVMASSYYAVRRV